MQIHHAAKLSIHRILSIDNIERKHAWHIYKLDIYV